MIKKYTTCALGVLAIGLLSAPMANAGTVSNHLCQSAYYDCYRVKPHDSWDSLFRSSSDKDIVMRVNRYANRLYPGLKIAIPKNLGSAGIMSYSPFPYNISPPGRKLIYVSINPQVLAWGAYNSQGTLIKWGPALSAKGYCPDIGRSCHTSTGKFAIYTKQGAGCKSTKFPVGRGGAPMPWCMLFNGGFALHGSYDLPGYNASHGCIRLFVQDAKWLNQEFVGSERVAVIVSNGRSP